MVTRPAEGSQAYMLAVEDAQVNEYDSCSPSESCWGGWRAFGSECAGSSGYDSQYSSLIRRD